ncbi:MAG: aminodeoxychorismate synthase component I [Sulfurospirillaceae bacterium]|nr:aminodeoxychorismate synthase component I [Sulfurospirillaceae bacterium]
MEFAQALNAFGKTKTPFFFVVNYAKDNFIVEPLSSLRDGIYYDLKGFNNTSLGKVPINQARPLCKEFIAYSRYQEAFSRVIEEIKAGNTYLLNLTAPTKIKDFLDLELIFHRATAPFKLYIKDTFVCFSPERFVKIEEQRISTYPMKGTINATLPNAREVILADEKEMAEHVMVVDLLRNDLSMVAKNVRVEAFRYIEKIHAGDHELLQISSKIVGDVDDTWHQRVGDILDTMLPAGSITGTPKKKSIEIIADIEGYDRGFFSGIFGVYDGKMLDSAVMIRFIEQTQEGYVFKSGGGITLLSECQKEYDELCDKVYIPCV